jgi:hypothetical protein
MRYAEKASGGGPCRNPSDDVFAVSETTYVRRPQALSTAYVAVDRARPVVPCQGRESTGATAEEAP